MILREFSVSTDAREGLYDITDRVSAVVTESCASSELCVVYTPHTTAAVTINESADPDVAKDIISGLSRIVPEDGFAHAEGNSPAHIKSSVVGCSETLMVEGGRLRLGTWQGIFFCEFDGPRTRKVFVQLL